MSHYKVELPGEHPIAVGDEVVGRVGDAVGMTKEDAVDASSTPEAELQYGERQVHAWVTKFAFSEGVIEVDGVWHQDKGRMLSYASGRVSAPMKYAHGNDWHLTKADADVRVMEMVSAKLKSLDKERAKVLEIGRALGMHVENMAVK